MELQRAVHTCTGARVPQAHAQAHASGELLLTQVRLCVGHGLSTSSRCRRCWAGLQPQTAHVHLSPAGGGGRGRLAMIQRLCVAGACACHGLRCMPYAGLCSVFGLRDGGWVQWQRKVYLSVPKMGHSFLAQFKIHFSSEEIFCGFWGGGLVWPWGGGSARSAPPPPRAWILRSALPQLQFLPALSVCLFFKFQSNLLHPPPAWISTSLVLRPSGEDQYELLVMCLSYVESFCYRNKTNQIIIARNVDVLMQRLGNPGGVAALSAIYRDNYQLCLDLNHSTISTFCELMVAGEFPRPEFMRLLKNLISVNGRICTHTQAMILRCLFEKHHNGDPIFWCACRVCLTLGVLWVGVLSVLLESGPNAPPSPTRIACLLPMYFACPAADLGIGLVPLHLDAPRPRRGLLPSSVWTRHGAVKQGQSGDSVGTTSRRQGRGRREVRIGQAGGGRARGGERPMGITAFGGKGVKGRARVSGERPMGAARCRQQHHRASCHTHPPSKPGG